MVIRWNRDQGLRLPKFRPSQYAASQTQSKSCCVERWCRYNATQTHHAGRKQLFGPNGKKLTKKVQMAPGSLTDGTPQSFYFPEGHEAAGCFEGMRVILEERGFGDQIRDLKRECPKFRCPPDRTDCCIRRTLYSQPDFRGVTSLLEEHCGKRGFEVLFLPKFHPELNFIEQCWGRAKWEYRQLPASSREEDLGRNALKSLDGIPLQLMRW